MLVGLAVANSLTRAVLCITLSSSITTIVVPQTRGLVITGFTTVHCHTTSCIYSLPLIGSSSVTCAGEWISILARSFTLVIRFTVNLSVGRLLLDAVKSSTLNTGSIFIIEVGVILIQVTVVNLLIRSWSRPAF